jgi:2-methylcitrate dehydratase PrpD
VDGQFSAVFQAAVALLDGRVTWDSYSRIADPDLRALAGRIELSTDHTLPEAGAVLTVVDGEVTTVRVDQPSGEPGTDLSWELVRTKYDSLTLQQFPTAVATGIVDLETCTSVRALLSGLRRPLFAKENR